MQMLDLAFGALFLNFPPPPRTPSVNFKSSYFHMEGAARKTKAYFEKTWADSGHFSQKIFLGEKSQLVKMEIINWKV